MKSIRSLLRTLQFIWNHPISATNRSTAYSRLIRWQLVTRILKTPVVLPFANDAFLVTERSMTGATGNYYCGLHEFTDMAFLLHFLRDEDSFLDLGANVGSYTVLASAIVGARSIAVEPAPQTFQNLKRNIRINDLSELVEAHCVAIGDTPGFVNFSIDRDTVNQVVQDNYSGKSQKVAVTRLDDLIVNRSPRLWKVDVEGFELEVLKGAPRSLGNPQLCAILLEDDSTEIEFLMRTAGFERSSYDPLSRNVIRIDRKQPTSRESLNNLWIRNLEFVSTRCKTARTYSLHGKTF